MWSPFLTPPSRTPPRSRSRSCCCRAGRSRSCRAGASAHPRPSSPPLADAGDAPPVKHPAKQSATNAPATSRTLLRLMDPLLLNDPVMHDGRERRPKAEQPPPNQKTSRGRDGAVIMAADAHEACFRAARVAPGHERLRGLEEQRPDVRRTGRTVDLEPTIRTRRAHPGLHAMPCGRPQGDGPGRLRGLRKRRSDRGHRPEEHGHAAVPARGDRARSTRQGRRAEAGQHRSSASAADLPGHGISPVFVARDQAGRGRRPDGDMGQLVRPADPR